MSILLFFLLSLFLLILYRTYTFQKKSGDFLEPKKEKIDPERAIENLSAAIGFRTISGKNPEEFERFISFLEKTYPLVHRELKREIINEHSLLYHWAGKNQSEKAALLMAHSDVVPVEEDTEKEWTHPPFSGKRADGFIWGRGAIDNKNNIIAQLEAVEELLASSFKPERDIFLAYGHDEEIRGPDGALAIADLLKERGIDLYLVLDEGGGVMEGVIKDLSTPAALVGTAEKGFVNLKLTARSGGGHSATPPTITGLGRLARAVVRLETKKMRPRISKPVREMLDHIGPEMSTGKRLVIANLWLFRPLFIRKFSAFPGGNALLRTTVAPTMAEGSKASNVLPDSPSFTINFRLLPGDSVNDLVDHVKKTVADNEIEIEVLNAYEPSLVSDGRGEEFQFLRNRILETFPQATVAPYLVFGGTDARHFEPVCSQIFRFSPMKIKDTELKRVHAVDERISEENIERMVSFYKRFLEKI